MFPICLSPPLFERAMSSSLSTLKKAPKENPFSINELLFRSCSVRAHFGAQNSLRYCSTLRIQLHQDRGSAVLFSKKPTIPKPLYPPTSQLRHPFRLPCHPQLQGPNPLISAPPNEHRTKPDFHRGCFNCFLPAARIFGAQKYVRYCCSMKSDFGRSKRKTPTVSPALDPRLSKPLSSNIATAASVLQSPATSYCTDRVPPPPISALPIKYGTRKCLPSKAR